MERKRSRIALALMGKSPRPGWVKTRLSPPLTPEEAAEVYRAMLLDKFDQAASLDCAEIWMAYAAPEDESFFRANSPPGAHLLLQRGADLGERMHNVVSDVLKSGAAGALLTGTDLPTVDNMLLRAAVEHLAGGAVDLVIGPSVDGGYYLIGLCDAEAAIFSDIEWSTDRVFAQTLARARAVGMRVVILEERYDVDDVAGLDRLSLNLNENPMLAPRTAAFLRRRRLR